MGAWFVRLWDRLVQDYLGNFDVKAGADYARHLINSILIWIVCWLAIRLARFIIRRLDNRVDRIHGSAYRRRIETITSLAFSATKYVIYLAGLFAVLAE